MRRRYRHDTAAPLAVPPVGVTLRGYTARMSESFRYTVPGMSCSHCEEAVRAELQTVDGVASVDVDLASKRVTVAGDGLDDAVLRAAIGEAGYEAA